MPPRTSLLLPSVLFGLCLLATPGCDSPSRQEPPAGSAARAAPVSALRGQSPFFDGKLLAEATVGRGPGPGFGRHGGGGGSGGGRYGRGSGRHGGGRGMRGGGEGGMPPGDADGGESGAPRAMNPMSRSLPPVTLRLQLKNQSTDALDVHILDVKSELGDFVAQPEHLLLAPGQASEIDPMFSQLGVPTDGFQIMLRLRAGDKTETQQLVLHVVTEGREDEAAKPRP